MIRRATLADVAGLMAVVNAAYAPFAAQGITLPPVADGLDNDIRDNHVWVADVDGRILGGVVLVLGDHAHLANLAVHPDGAGQGIGQALTETAFQAASDVGFTEIALATHRDMNGTQAFYAKRGWVETGREGTKIYMTYDLNQRTDR